MSFRKETGISQNCAVLAPGGMCMWPTDKGSLYC